MNCPKCGSRDTMKSNLIVTGHSLTCFKCGFMGKAHGKGQNRDQNGINIDKFQD